MAYTKKSSARKSASRSSYSSRSASKRTSRSGSRKSATRSVQTLRIVVEQPQALSSVPGQLAPANQNSPRKAAF